MSDDLQAEARIVIGLLAVLTAIGFLAIALRYC